MQRKADPIFINPFTDYGFKKLFGEESSKPQLISFINAFLELENKDKIVDLEFRNLEKLGVNITDRKLIYDIYCIDESGNHIIVELQKAKQNYFKDRSIYYSTFPIQQQAEKGDWDFKLKSVYTIRYSGFCF